MKVVAFELEDWERANFQKLKQEHELALTAKALKNGFPKDTLMQMQYPPSSTPTSAPELFNSSSI